MLGLTGLKTLISDVPDGFGASVAQRLTVRLLGGVEQDKTVRGGEKLHERGGGWAGQRWSGKSRVGFWLKSCSTNISYIDFYARKASCSTMQRLRFFVLERTGVRRESGTLRVPVVPST